MDDGTRLGDLIRSRRIQLGLTQVELASRSSTGGEVVRQSDISRLERGQIQLPRRSRLERIADALGLSLGEILVNSGWAGADEVLTSVPTNQHSERDEEILASRDQLLDAWRAFQRGGTQFEQLRPVTLEAWQRCRDIGVDPRDIVFRFLSPRELDERRAANAAVIGAARPYLEHLSWALSGKPHIVSLTDREGWVLDLLGPVEALGGRASGLAVGCNWSEASIGNNGVGTALVTGLPVLVYGIEHYAQLYHATACLGVPIRRLGELVAALGIGVPQEHAHPDQLNLAQACARSIESLLAAGLDQPVPEHSDYPPPSEAGTLEQHPV